MSIYDLSSLFDYYNIISMNVLPVVCILCTHVSIKIHDEVIVKSSITLFDKLSRRVYIFQAFTYTCAKLSDNFTL